jgi:hypothetical protein
MKTTLLIAISAIVISILTSCANCGTHAEQITGSYVSPVKYKHYTCRELATESSSLSRRLNSLTIAQESRVDSNQVQAFWLGYGNGDGIVAAELATVKGEKEAVRSTMQQKQCK